MKQSHLIALNTIIIWGTTVLQVIPPLILVPFLIKALGDSGYGEYTMIWALLMAVEQLATSLQAGGTKFGAAAMAQGRTEEVNRVLSSTFVFAVGLAVLASLGVAGTAIASFGQTKSMMISLLIVGAMMLFLIPGTPFVGIIQAKQRHFVNAIAGIGSQYAGLVLAVAWFRLVGPSVEALIAIMAGTLLVSRLAQVPVAYKLVPGLKLRLRSFDAATFRRIFGFGTAVILMSLCLTLNSAGIRWLSGLLVSTAFVAHLAIILMPGTMMSQVVLAMTITVMPATSAYDASNDRSMLRELFLRSTRYVVLLVSAGLLAAYLLIGDILRLWVGPQYMFLGVYILVYLLGVAIQMSSSCAHQMLKGLGLLRKVLGAYVLGMLVIPFSVFLAINGLWRSPYWAVSIGLLLGNLTAGVLQLRACVRAVEIDAREFVVRAFLQPLAPAVVVGGLTVALRTLAGPGSFVLRLAVAAMSVGLVFGSFYLLLAGPQERRLFKEFLHMLKGRLGGGPAPAPAPHKADPDV